MINWDKLFTDYYIDFSPQNNRGWTETRCPFCDDTGKRGGFNKGGNYSCFRCGKNNPVLAISKILSYPYNDAKALIQRYSTGKDITKEIKKEFAEKTILPPEVIYDKLTPLATNYLTKRGFDPEVLFKDYKIRSCDIFGNFAYRLIAPIYRQNKLISYIGRACGESKTKYLACPINQESHHYKWSLYGINQLRNKKAIIVEGITDVWRLGIGSLAIYGVKFTRYQVLELARNISMAYILLDPDDAGQLAAERLQRELELFSVKTEILVESSEKDPGEYTSMEAKEIMKGLEL